MGRDKVAGFEKSILAAVAALGDDAYGLTIYNKALRALWSSALQTGSLPLPDGYSGSIRVFQR